MRTLIYLGWHSLRNRRATALLTLLVIALSVTLLLAVERLRHDVREGFASTVSGTDLIVGARGGSLQLLLYSLFHVGDATQNIRWSSVEALRANPAVDWVVPLSLGDSHRGFRVVGTTPELFSRYYYGHGRALALAAGKPFAGLFEAVIGTEVARSLGYAPGASIVLAHGSGIGRGAEHADKPFTVVGVLAPSGTPLDRAVLVSLEAIEAIHLDWQGGVPILGLHLTAEQVRKFSLQPREVTAALVGLKNRVAVFRVQRAVNEYPDEPLQAVLPGVALDQLWQVVGIAERALRGVALMVLGVSLVGLCAVMMAGLGERRRELAILRAQGASPGQIFLLLMLESLALTLAGGALGILLCQGLVWALAPWVAQQWGLWLEGNLPLGLTMTVWALVVLAGLLASLWPALRAYRQSLADGMSVRT